MSFFDSASLVQIPSGIKDGVLYSVKPIDGSGDLTFSRGSDIEATRVNANGYIEKAQVNLLLQSNQFDTTWANSASTETGGQAGYDGTNDAWLLEKSGVNGRIQQTIVSSGVQTFSVYAKAGTKNWTNLMVTTGSGDRTCFFDLQNGVIGFNANLIDKKIESVGAGWYRCSITFDETSATARIYVSDGNNDNSGTSGNIYIQDAQLNYGLVAQTYQETTTAAVVSGITDNMPRLNYDPANPTCPSLLLEPSRTNEIPNSEYLSAWGASNVSVTQNTAISPEGVQNASTIEVTTQTASQGLAQGFVADGTSYYTISGYYKKTATSQRAQLKIRDFLGSGTTYGFVDLDLSTGSVVASIGTYSVTSFNSDWWYIQVTTGSVPSAGIRRAVIRLDNQTVGTQITAYGIMVEKGTYATSYIPSYGSSATRTSESCSKTGISSLIGSTEGVLYAEVDVKLLQQAGRILLDVNDNNTTNRVLLLLSGSNVEGFVQGSTRVEYTLPSAGIYKFAFAYKSGDFALYVNGVQQDTSTDAITFSGMNQLFLGHTFNINNTQPVDGIKSALLFKTRLSNADLATLTTL